MKLIIVFGALLYTGLLQSQINVFECTPENSQVTQQELESSEDIFKNCAVFESTLPYTYTGTANKKITAVNSIEIKSGFFGAPTENGSLSFNINKADFEVYCMNYPDLKNVLKFKRFELGITLPQSVQEQVDNFVNDVATPDKINPYMEDEIRVVAEFSNLQLQSPHHRRLL